MQFPPSLNEASGVKSETAEKSTFVKPLIAAALIAISLITVAFLQMKYGILNTALSYVFAYPMASVGFGLVLFTGASYLLYRVLSKEQSEEAKSSSQEGSVVQDTGATFSSGNSRIDPSSSLLSQATFNSDSHAFSSIGKPETLPHASSTGRNDDRDLSHEIPFKKQAAVISGHPAGTIHEQGSFDNDPSFVSSSPYSSISSFVFVEPKLSEVIKEYSADETVSHVISAMKRANRYNNIVQPDEDLDLEKPQYLRIEETIRKNPKEIPLWEPCGFLHYGMSIEDMKNAISQSILKLSKEGFVYQSDSQQVSLNQDKSNIASLWGALFLRSNLKLIPNIKVVDQCLLISNQNPAIEIKVDCTSRYGYPYISHVNNSQIYRGWKEGMPLNLAEEMKGPNKAALAKLDELGYRKFDTMIKDMHGIYWIVDTDMDCFVNTPQIVNKTLLHYLEKRFKLLNTDFIRNGVITFSEL